MRSITHALLAATTTSLALGTASPALLISSALASQLPDVDTSKSVPGQILLPVSSWLEKHFPHRTITHSFLATVAIALLFLPLVLLSAGVWQALVLGYFCGWFGDVFTKSGVAAFYPSVARLVIPGNPRLRLSTGSNSEYFLMAVLVLLAALSIQINSSGGVLQTFTQSLGLPSGAVEIINTEGAQYLLFARLKGRAAVTQQPINDEFEVIRALTQNDLLVKDRQGKVYRSGTSQECQIIANQVFIRRSNLIRSRVQEIQLDDQLLADVMPQFPPKLADRTYINGTLALADAEDLSLPTQSARFDTIALQPGRDRAIARLESASPSEILSLLGDYYATGNLIIRTVEVL